jgi:CDP-glucose 4,6-dehydratase
MSAPWHGRTVLVTGAGGFMGGCTVDLLLERGARVIGMVRDTSSTRRLDELGLLSRMELVRGSVTDGPLVAATVRDGDVDCIVHLAAETAYAKVDRDPVATFEANVAGTWHVLEAARLAGAGRAPAVVAASTSKVYDARHPTPWTEETPVQSSNPYAASKVCMEAVCQAYARSFEVAVAVVRFPTVYGPGDLDWARLVPSAIRSALAGERPEVLSDGSPERDYLYLSDAAAGLLAAAEHLPAVRGGVFNIGTGTATAVSDVVDHIVRLTGLTPVERPATAALEVPVAPGQAVDRHCLDPTRAKERLGWAPQVDVATGLEMTVDWFRTYLR